jgi:flavin reductase (DIM6/NTAB) family NADH-FMN oxidoreductase RutF
MPSGLYVVGSRSDVKRNLMTLNLATQVSTEPKLVGIVVEQSALTHQLIHDGRAYSLCMIDREDRAIVRKFVKPVEMDEAAQTLNGFPYHDGPTTGVPVLDQAVAWLECQVRQEVEVGNHTFFIGEVVNAGFQRAEETPVLRMEDTRMSYGG